MKVINIDSDFDLTQAQISFAETVMHLDRPFRFDRDYPSTSLLTEHIPIFLFCDKSMPKENLKFEEYENNNLFSVEEPTPSTDWLGFYQNQSSIYGVDTPIIGLCPERIMGCVNNDEELIVLIAKVIVHEFAHAQMTFHPRDSRRRFSVYHPVDLFYKWMEEPMANVITLERFYALEKNYYSHNIYAHCSKIPSLINPFDFVKDFINRQPQNYRLGLDFYSEKFWRWWDWRRHKDLISSKTVEKSDWLNYVRLNVGGGTSKIDLENLFKALI